MRCDTGALLCLLFLAATTAITASTTIMPPKPTERRTAQSLANRHGRGLPGAELTKADRAEEPKQGTGQPWALFTAIKKDPRTVLPSVEKA